MIKKLRFINPKFIDNLNSKQKTMFDNYKPIIIDICGKISKVDTTTIIKDLPIDEYVNYIPVYFIY